MQVVFVSSGRADIGIQSPIWEALSRRTGIDINIVLTGMHCADSEGRPDVDQCVGATVHQIGADLRGRKIHGNASTVAPIVGAAMARIVEDTSALLSELDPDLLVVIGDRLDMLPVVVGSLPLNCPILHVHGGEVTLGAIDERVRHAVTKMAHLHATSSVDAANRVHAMGEESWRIRVTGAPGLDWLLNQPVLSAGDTARALGLPTVDGLRIVTVHPETNSADPAAPGSAVFTALAAAGDKPTIITGTNSDPGAAEIAEIIEKFRSGRQLIKVSNSLGAEVFANSMRHAEVMVGNSSSGIIEAPLFGCPVINVGGRQLGRREAENVATVANDADAVLQLLLHPPRRSPVKSPFGDGKAAPRIAQMIAEAPPRAELLLKRYVTPSDQFSAPWT